MIYFIFMQLNQQEYIKEKPFCQSVSMEEQGDKYLICFVCCLMYKLWVHIWVELFTASEAAQYHILYKLKEKPLINKYLTCLDTRVKE